MREEEGGGGSYLYVRSSYIFIFWLCRAVRRLLPYPAKHENEPV